MNNKNIKKSIILILLVIAGITEGCKKYEDGPWVSFRSAKNRFYGYHTLITYNVNGVDSLSSYYDSLGLKFNFIHDDDYNSNVCIMDGKRKDGLGELLFWYWELSKSKKQLIIKGTSGSSIGTGPFGINKTPEWEILKLKWNDIKMKTNYNNKEYFIELKGN